MAKSLSLLILGILVLLLNGLDVEAETRPFGAGIVLGEPTGVSLEYQLSRRNHLQGALAWDLGGPSDVFVVQADYIWNMIDLIRISKEVFDLYFGIGGQILFASETGLAARVPVGVAYTVKSPKIEIFFELVPALLLTPATEGDLQLGIGARYYF